RNLDDRIDLTEEFSAATGERTRSVVDVDFDGRADLLVLFADNQPVFSEWAPKDAQIHTTPNPVASLDVRERREDEALRSFDDPFSSAQRLRAAAPSPRNTTGCTESQSRLAGGCAFVPAEQVVKLLP